MNLYEHISSNKRKSVILVILFFAIIVSLGYFLGFFIGNALIGIAAAVAVSISMVLMSYFSGDRLILKMSHAVEADRKKFPHLVNPVEGLSIASGIPPPKIYVINDTAINAFAIGRSPKNASVTVTTGAVERLKRDALEGVIAHELAHIRNYGKRKGSKGGKGAALLMVIGLVLALLSPFIAQLIKFAVSSQREYLADADGALMSRNPQGLANALKKIRDDKEPLVEAANKATAHLFIENPLRSFKGRINHLFLTHPP